MNIEEIKAFAAELQQLGFTDILYPMVKRISLRTAEFIIQQKISRNNTELNFQLSFEKSNVPAGYSLKYYDAIFRLENDLSNNQIDGIGISELDSAMKQIDWQDVFDFRLSTSAGAARKTDFEKAQQTENVITRLEKLEETEEGRQAAASLKVRHWAGCGYHEVFGNIQQARDKNEIMQRFFFFEGQTGISVDEAFRFLQNKWQEKQLSIRKKETAVESGSADSSSSSSGKGLLQKKKLSPKKHSAKTAIK